MALGLQDMSRRWRVQEASAKMGTGVEQAMDWVCVAEGCKRDRNELRLLTETGQKQLRQWEQSMDRFPSSSPQTKTTQPADPKFLMLHPSVDVEPLGKGVDNAAVVKNSATMSVDDCENALTCLEAELEAELAKVDDPDSADFSTHMGRIASLSVQIKLAEEALAAVMAGAH